MSLVHHLSVPWYAYIPVMRIGLGSMNTKLLKQHSSRIQTNTDRLSNEHKAQGTIYNTNKCSTPREANTPNIFVVWTCKSYHITPPQTKGYQQEGETKNTHTYFHLKYLIQVPHQAKCQNLVQIV